MGLSPVQVLKAARAQGITEVLCAFSTGKDSLYILDLCVKMFDRVVPYFLYWIPSLSFQTRTISWAQQRYGLEVLQFPHAFLSTIYLNSDYRHDLPKDELKKKMSLTEQENAIRATTHLEWIVTGPKRADSLWRRGALFEVAQTQGISAKRRNIFPLIDLTDSHVFNYLKMNRIPLPAEYRVFAGITPHSPSFDLNSKHIGRYLIRIRDTWPEDYAKIVRQFPLTAAMVCREEMYGAEEAAEATARRAAGVEKRKAKRAIPNA